MLSPEKTWNEHNWHGSIDSSIDMLPTWYVPKVLQTESGTYYLQEAGVSMIARTEFLFRNVGPFVKGLPSGDDPEQDVPAHYMQDVPGMLESLNGEALAKYAGQVCYLSFGPKRTWNKDTGKYLTRIMSRHHGSVLEHATFTFQLWGISRSVTHELVRHRAGFSYSQVSQRYVGPDMLRFVERPEFRYDDKLHNAFVAEIDYVRKAYRLYIERLLEREREIAPIMVGAMSATEERKAVQQAARAVLPNMTEAPIVVTANVRAWRHFLSERGSIHAEPEIRYLAYKVWTILRAHSPLLFGDYEWREGVGLYTPYWKV